jgi:hypothetical protein
MSDGRNYVRATRATEDRVAPEPFRYFLTAGFQCSLLRVAVIHLMVPKKSGHLTRRSPMASTYQCVTDLDDLDFREAEVWV